MLCLLPFAILFSYPGLSFEYVNSYPASSHENAKRDQHYMKQVNEVDLEATTENVSRYNRQLDSDVESRFMITPNTIIRTGESRILGAKYINETVLASNRDCLTWCLETPNCNAAVYEEKDAQSCYMFNCGGPSASLCKFTSHSFFISSVLKVTQHSYELSQWGNQVKHEKELAELRKSDFVSHSSSSPPLEQNSVLVTSEPPPHLSSPVKPENPCHHYQFKCLNSSECIAIYNVCDGIPQCPDESDESIELKCHEKESKVTSHKTEKTINKPDLNPNSHLSENGNSNPNFGSKMTEVANGAQANPPNNQSPSLRMNPNHSNHREESRHSEGEKNIWPNKPPVNQESRKNYYHNPEGRGNAADDGLGSPFVHKHSQFVAANDAHVQNRNHWSNDYDQYPSHSISMDQQYTPYEGGNFQRIEDQYGPNQLSPDYDSAKGYSNFRQEDIPYWATQDASFPVDEYPQPAVHKQSNYPNKESVYAQQLARQVGQYPEIKHHIMHKAPDPIADNSQQGRSSDIDAYNSHRIALQRQQPYLTYDENLQKQLYPEPKPPKNYPPHNMEDSVYNSDDLIRASLVNQLPLEMDHPHHSYEFSMKHPVEPTVHQDQEKVKESHETKELPKDSLIIVKPTKPPPKPIQRTVWDFKMSVTELYQSSRTHSQEANSAILALVMGVTVTFFLLVFLVCRIKTIRKRLSKKGRVFAHDADYLVNGMYL